MPSHLKELVRVRMEKTGESYQQALRKVRAQEARTPEEAPIERAPTRAQSVADTAFSIAAVRAEEAARPAEDRLFEDPYAPAFASAGAHAAESTQRFLELPNFRDQVRLRTRYLDDCVREGLAAGLRQLVILGAGFDARGLRLAEVEARGVKVFEVDTPYQLERKREALGRAGFALPSWVHYVPFDFDTADLGRELEGALEIAGFESGAGAMFLWEGVIGYIDDATIDASLRAMAKIGGPKTRLAFTFADEAYLGLEPMGARVARTGYRSLEAYGGDALWRRYWHGDPPANVFVGRVGVALV